MFLCMFLEKSIQKYEKNVDNRKKYVTIIVCAFAGKVHTQGSFVKIRS